MTLMLFTLVRHHHHEERICFEFQYCSECENGATETDGDEHHELPCISEVNFLASDSMEIRCKASCCNNPDHYGHPIILKLFDAADVFSLWEASCAKPKRDEYDVLLPFSDAPVIYGLRAPPFIRSF